MKNNLILAVLCGVSLLVNVLLFLVVRNCYREKSPDEKSELEKFGMTCVYNGGSVGLYERRGGTKRRRKEIRGIRARLRRLEDAGIQLEAEGRGCVPLYLGSA